MAAKPPTDPPKSGMHLKNFQNLIVELKDRLLIIKLNRPHVKNAIDRLTVYEMIRVLGEGSNDPNISMIVISNTGDCFSSGNDLKQIDKYEDKNIYFKTANYVLRALVVAFLSCRKLIVTIVNGAAIGFGFTMCGLSDIVYCTQNSYFQAPFTQAGLCPEACSSLIFPRIMGRSKASEVLLLGHRMSAQEAYDFHFVSQVFRDLVDVETNLMVQLKEYAKLSIPTLEKNKSLILRPMKQEMLQTLEQENKTLAEMRHSDTYKAYVASFVKGKNSKL